jgi:hypothetical protein
VPPGIDLLFLLLSLVVKPVFFMNEKLATHPALDYMVLVRVSLVQDQLVIASKVLVAVIAFGLLAVE